MQKKITVTLLPLFIGLILFLSGCTPPTSGIFWDLEREKVITVRNSLIAHDVTTSQFQKYTNSNNVSFFVLLSGTSLFVANDPVDAADGWHQIGIVNSLAFTDMVVVGTKIYAITVGNSGSDAGILPAIYSTSLTSLNAGAIYPIWTKESGKDTAITITPIKLAVGGPTLSPTLILQSDASDSYKIYKYAAGVLTGLSGPTAGMYKLVKASPGLLVTQGAVYSLDLVANTYADTALNFAPSTASSIVDAFTDVVDNGAKVFVARSGGYIYSGTSPNGGAWSSSDALSRSFSSLAWVNIRDDANPNDSSKNFNHLLAGTKGQGLVVIDTTAKPKLLDYTATTPPALPAPLDVITNGNFASTHITSLSGIYADPNDPTKPIYFTTFIQGLWSSVYLTSSGQSNNGLIFTWQ